MIEQARDVATRALRNPRLLTFASSPGCASPAASQLGPPALCPATRRALFATKAGADTPAPSTQSL